MLAARSSVAVHDLSHLLCRIQRLYPNTVSRPPAALLTPGMVTGVNMRTIGTRQTDFEGSGAMRQGG
jgi:hypothetical protein